MARRVPYRDRSDFWWGLVGLATLVAAIGLAVHTLFT